MSGFEAYKDNGGIQFLSNRGTLPLYQKQSLTVALPTNATPSMYLPYELVPGKAPIIAVRPPANSTGMTKIWEWLWNETESAQTGNRGGATFRFPAAYNTNGSGYDVFIFSTNRNLSNSNFGFQAFDEGGTLIYDMQDRPFRVVDQFECTTWQATNTGWTENRTYDPSRSYAIIQTNLNTSTYFTYSNRVYDSQLKQYIYYYNGAGYGIGYRPISGGFQFFNMPGAGGGGTDEQYSQVANYWGNVQNNNQRHLIVDVTGY